MGIYYYAVSVSHRKYFSPPEKYNNKKHGIYHPENPFPHMVIMKNVQGYNFDIWDDCGNDIPPSDDYEDITDAVYKEYLNSFKEYFTDKDN